MKIFAVSDIHSFFTEFKEALDEAGFEPGNKDHLLVVCGDCLDRGSETNEVVEFLSSLTNVVLVKGNHEVLMEAIWKRGSYLSYDKHNGTVRSVQDIFYKNVNMEPYEPIKVSEKVLRPFFDKMVNYFETERFIFIHSFLPLKYDTTKKFAEYGDPTLYKEDWREATNEEWEEAMWGNPFKLAEAGLNQTGKTLVFGHWGTYETRPSNYEGNDLFSPVYGRDYIGLDATTALSGEVNVIVLEDELLETT